MKRFFSKANSSQLIASSLLTSLKANSSQLAAISLLTVLTACGGQKDPAAELAKLKQEQAATQARITDLETKAGAPDANGAAQAVPVSVLDVQPTSFSSYLEVQGRADFDQNANVSPRAPGVITSIRVQRGDQVSKGQILATLDATVLDAGIAELRTRLDLARVIYEKQKRLWDQQIGTEIQYLQAKNNYEALQNNLSTQQRQRDQFNVRAPFAGVVDDVPAKVGEASSPGAPVVRLLSGSTGKIVADVSEAYASSIKPGDKALVNIPDLGATDISSTVRTVSRIINPSSRTFSIELRLNGPEAKRLRPNMVATVRIQNYSQKNATVLPVDLVQRDEQNSYVYVVEQQGQKKVAAKRIIKTGATYNGNVEVTSGLKPDDQVVSMGYQNLNEGQLVAVSS